MDRDNKMETPLSQKDLLQLVFKDNVEQWFKDRGDLTHRLNYDLNKDSVVIDVGGYVGDWASNIFSKYQCTVVVLEPIKEYFEFIKNRFSTNSHILTENIGLGTESKIGIMCISNDGTSAFTDFRKADSLEICKFVDVNEFIDQYNYINLIKLNIEGAEYDILERISDKNLEKLGNIQIQFHTFVEDCVIRRDRIREHLSKTHELTYDYGFVWENWQIKTP